MKWCLLLLAIVAAFALERTPGGEPVARVVLGTDGVNDAFVSDLRSSGYDVLGHADKGNVQLIVSFEELEQLQKETNMDLTPVEYARPLNEDIPSGYHSPDQVLHIMNQTAERYPNIVEYVDLTARYAMSETVEGRRLYAVKISKDVKSNLDLPNILVVSSHHAREIATPELALAYIERITKGYSNGDAEFVQLLDKFVIWVAPCWNPDGTHYVWEHNNMWRKNRLGGYGVDQNRNYELGWDTYCGGSDYKWDQTYKGARANSEVETQLMIKWSQDQNFAKVIDYHSYGEEVLHGYVCPEMPSIIAQYTEREAGKLAEQCDYGTRKPSGDGEHQQWSILRTTSYSFLAELDGSFQPSYYSTLQEIDRVWPQSMYFLKHPLSIEGHVKDNSGRPLKAAIKVAQVQWQNGETRFSAENNHGRYHLNLPEGTYDVTFTAESYSPKTVQITVQEGQTTVQDIVLN